MPNKTEEYLALACKTADSFSRQWEHWAEFLITAARLYKYSYPDQLMIYAQRPDATACAEYDVFSTTDKYFAEQSGMTSYPLFVCGQMVLLESPELAAALSALSQMEQEIIFLYYFQRLTHREIGRRYGRAGNTTGRRIQMILRRLRAELEGLSYEPATSL